MTKHIKKGTKKNLIRVHKKIIIIRLCKIYIGKEDIINAIMKYNKAHFIIALKSKVYQDKIYFKLQDDE